MTQAQTAEAAGMTQPNLSDWLRGVSDVRGDTLLRLLRAVGIEPYRPRNDSPAHRHPRQARSVRDEPSASSP